MTPRLINTQPALPLNLADILWRRPPATMVDDLPQHREPYRLFVPNGLRMPPELPLVPNDCSATFKTARVDIVWQKMAEPKEWLEMLNAMHGTAAYAEGGPGVQLKLIVGEMYRVTAHRLTTSLMPLDYVFAGESPEGHDDDSDEMHERRKVPTTGVPVPCRQTFHVEVTLTDALRALIAEKADLVRVHLDGTKQQDVA